MKHAQTPQRGSSAIWQLVGLGAVVILSLFVLVQLTGTDASASADRVTLNTETDRTSPILTQAPSTSRGSSPTTETTSTTEAPVIGETTTAEAPATTEAPITAPRTTSPPATTDPTTPPTTHAPMEIPGRAIAQRGSDLVWVDTMTGEADVIREFVFEAAWARGLGLSPDGLQVYYQRMAEDNWFSCESIAGDVVRMDLDSASTTLVARGFTALSPDGDKLAYLTTDECHTDPDEPGFFVPGYDTLVVTDGDEMVEIPLERDVESDGGALVNVVWIDSDTLLVADEADTYYRVPIDGSGGDHIEAHDSFSLPGWELYAVVDGRALTAEYETIYGPRGDLQVVDLETLAFKPLEWDGPDSGFSYAVGISAEGKIIVAVTSSADGSKSQLLVDVDLDTSKVGAVIDTARYTALDW